MKPNHQGGGPERAIDRTTLFRKLFRKFEKAGLSKVFQHNVPNLLGCVSFVLFEKNIMQCGVIFHEKMYNGLLRPRPSGKVRVNFRSCLQPEIFNIYTT